MCDINVKGHVHVRDGPAHCSELFENNMSGIGRRNVDENEA